MFHEESVFICFFVILVFARKHSANLNFCFLISELFIQRYTAFIIRLNNLSFQVPVFVNGCPLFDLARLPKSNQHRKKSYLDLVILKVLYILRRPDGLKFFQTKVQHIDPKCNISLSTSFEGAAYFEVPPRA